MSESTDPQKLYEMLPLAVKTAQEVVTLLAAERARSGMTTEQIFEKAGITLEENDARLLEDLARLQG